MHATRTRMHPTNLANAVLLAALVSSLAGCRRLPAVARHGAKLDGSTASTSPAGSQTHPVADTARTPDAGPLSKAVPIPEEVIERAINPSNLAPYAGPTGTVGGTVTVRGDKPLETEIRAPAACGEAAKFFGPAFREKAGAGGKRLLADALVAVTNYEGFVPAEGDIASVEIRRGCIYDRRTYAITFGQRLEVKNLTLAGTFVPDLAGAQLPAQMAAMPNGDPVRLYPLRPGYYEIRDALDRPWMRAGVYVLKYSTHTVSDVDGHFQIGRIPVGKVKVSVLSPAIEAPAERVIEVRSGETTTVDLELVYKRPKPEAPRVENEPVVH